ncbi:hypothetical protein HDU93_000236 [Gonapodya sp. JEL0774]|nr:hypothetical protein HDU93_000236 [Gonapodya sp. JEL0774]
MPFASCARAIDEHTPSSDEEMNVAVGDVLWILQFNHPGPGWAWAINKRLFDDSNAGVSSPEPVSPRAVPMNILSTLPPLELRTSIYHWTPTHEDELHLYGEDRLVVRQRNEGGWWICSRTLDEVEEWGVVAENYMGEAEPTTPTSPADISRPASTVPDQPVEVPAFSDPPQPPHGAEIPPSEANPTLPSDAILNTAKVLPAGAVQVLPPDVLATEPTTASSAISSPQPKRRPPVPLAKPRHLSLGRSSKSGTSSSITTTSGGASSTSVPVNLTGSVEPEFSSSKPSNGSIFQSKPLVVVSRTENGEPEESLSPSTLAPLHPEGEVKVRTEDRTQGLLEVTNAEHAAGRVASLKSRWEASSAMSLPVMGAPRPPGLRSPRPLSSTHFSSIQLQQNIGDAVQSSELLRDQQLGRSRSLNGYNGGQTAFTSVAMQDVPQTPLTPLASTSIKSYVNSQYSTTVASPTSVLNEQAKQRTEAEWDGDECNSGYLDERHAPSAPEPTIARPLPKVDSERLGGGRSGSLQQLSWPTRVVRRFGVSVGTGDVYRVSDEAPYHVIVYAFDRDTISELPAEFEGVLKSETLGDVAKLRKVTNGEVLEVPVTRMSKVDAGYIRIRQELERASVLLTLSNWIDTYTYPPIQFKACLLGSTNNIAYLRELRDGIYVDFPVDTSSMSSADIEYVQREARAMRAVMEGASAQKPYSDDTSPSGASRDVWRSPALGDTVGIAHLREPYGSAPHLATPYSESAFTSQSTGPIIAINTESTHRIDVSTYDDRLQERESYTRVDEVPQRKHGPPTDAIPNHVTHRTVVPPGRSSSYQTEVSARLTDSLTHPQQTNQYQYSQTGQYKNFGPFTRVAPQKPSEIESVALHRPSSSTGVHSNAANANIRVRPRHESIMSESSAGQPSGRPIIPPSPASLTIQQLPARGVSAIQRASRRLGPSPELASSLRNAQMHSAPPAASVSSNEVSVADAVSFLANQRKIQTDIISELVTMGYSRERVWAILEVLARTTGGTWGTGELTLDKAFERVHAYGDTLSAEDIWKGAGIDLQEGPWATNAQQPQVSIQRTNSAPPADSVNSDALLQLLGEDPTMQTLILDLGFSERRVRMARDNLRARGESETPEKLIDETLKLPE